MAARIKKIKESAPCEPEAAKQSPLRDEKNLLAGADYVYKQYGKVDWRKMISKDHIALNRFTFACKGIDVTTLSEENVKKMIEESSDEDLVIKLAGFREIADCRGYESINSELLSASHDSVTIKVTIKWEPNFENPRGLTVSAIANASAENTDERFRKYLETIAENRAFVRAVRHSLGIFAVGQDEIKQEDVKIETRNIKIHSMLLELMSKLELDISSLEVLAAKEGFDWDDKWTSVEKIDPAAVITFIPILKTLIK